MNLLRLRAPGLWVPGSVLLPEEMEAFDAARELMINAGEGSMHAPSPDAIQVNGAGVEVTGPFYATAADSFLTDTGITITLPSGARVVVSPAGQGGSPVAGAVVIEGAFTLAGTGTFVSGSTLTQATGSTWALAGTTDVTGSGATLAATSTAVIRVEATGTFEIGGGGFGVVYGSLEWSGGSNWPLLSSRSISRSVFRLAGYDYTVGGGPTTPCVWPIFASGAKGAALLTASEDERYEFIIEFLDMPVSGTATSAVVRTRGVDGTPALTVASFQIVRWIDGGTLEAMSALTNDDRTGTNWTDEIDTTLTVNANATLSETYHYGVLVNTPYEAGGAASMLLLEATINVTVTDVRP
jgi:hypothetical protein